MNLCGDFLFLANIDGIVISRVKRKQLDTFDPSTTNMQSYHLTILRKMMMLYEDFVAGQKQHTSGYGKILKVCSLIEAYARFFAAVTTLVLSGCSKTFNDTEHPAQSR
jgi:hypothetical protein